MAGWNSGDGRYQEEEVLHGKWSKFRGQGSGGGLANAGFSSTAPPPRKRSKKCIGLCVIAALVVILACAIAIGVVAKVKNDDKSDDDEGERGTLNSLRKACNSTRFPDVCYNSLENFTTGSSNTLDFVKYSIAAATTSATKELENFQPLLVSSITNLTVYNAANDCIDFLQDALDAMNDTAQRMDSLSSKDLDAALADMRTWMSTSLTNQETCLDEINDLNSTDKAVVDLKREANATSELISNGLAFVTILRDLIGGLPDLNRRRLLSETTYETTLRRRLLQSTNFSPNVVVAQDNTGKYTTIANALKAVQDRDGDSQYVIYVKAGIYNETVLIDKKMDNILLVGDGIGKTIITNYLSVVGTGATTSKSATLTVQGKNFIGQDFTVENTAGPQNHQAVAARTSGDLALFQRCEFRGFQDTLYVHTNRQFYINCTVRGTVDFIFGNAAVVLQSCTIIAGTGFEGQTTNTFTASGRMDPNQNTGISFQRCNFNGTAELMADVNYRTYLGRPWKEYARTVVMQSTLGSMLAPEGWLSWNDEPRPNIYYAEYENNGPGADTARRVTWSEQITRPADAEQYTVDTFIQGDTWLPETGLSGYQKSL